MRFANGVAAAVGRTPLIKLKRASEETGCTILGKAEFMNPGQSVKDRAALFIIQDAVKRGTLRPGGTVVEGTAGNTGIGLTVIGNALGFRTVIVIPETQSQEKKDALRLLGAELVEVPAVPYKNPNNYVHYSAAPGRSAGQDRAQRRHLGQPVGQRRQPPGPHRDDGAGDLGRHRRQGRRLRVGGGLGRHAGRRLRRPQGQAQGHPDRARRRARRGALQLLHDRRAQGGGLLHHRGHRPGPRHQEHRGRRGRSRLPDPGCGGGGRSASSCCRRRACAWAARPASTSPAPSGWPRSWAPATPSSPCSATTARAISRSCSTRRSCKSKNLPVPAWLATQRSAAPRCSSTADKA